MFENERNEWIDHGKMMMQISQPSAGRCRVVGRDETTQKLRLCGNVESDSIGDKGSKAVSFAIKDFTGTWSDTGKDCLVSVRFASADIRDEFRTTYESCESGQ